MSLAARPHPGSGTTTIYRGHIFHIAGDATLSSASQDLVSLPDGALVVTERGTVGWVGQFQDLPAEFTAAETVRAGFVIPGLVDTHCHFAQTYATDAYGGGQLLEWLNSCIFPSEARLQDEAFAAAAAHGFVRRRTQVGTTAAVVFGSAFAHAQDALFAETRAAGLRMVSGRGVQTSGPESAAALITGEDEAIELVRDEIQRWHCADTGDPATALLQVAVVPRFSLSVTRRTLAALGELYAAVRGSGVYFHSHLNENNGPGGGEVAAVLERYQVHSYLDTYDGRFGPGSSVAGASFLGRRSILAHAVHCQDRELARMAETGTSIAHCPTSQQFLGSGTMPWRRTAAAGVTISVGTDIGAGDEWLVTRVLNDAYKVHISEPGSQAVAVHPAELLYSGTLAGAQALDMDARFGNFDLGKDADFLLVDPDRWEPLGRSLELGIRSDNEQVAAEQTLFSLLLGLREPAISGVFVQGRKVTPRVRYGEEANTEPVVVSPQRPG